MGYGNLSIYNIIKSYNYNLDDKYCKFGFTLKTFLQKRNVSKKTKEKKLK